MAVSSSWALQLLVLSTISLSHIHVVSSFHLRVQEMGFARRRILVCRRAFLSFVTTVTPPDTIETIQEPETTVEDEIQGDQQQEASLVIRADYIGVSKPAPATSPQAMADFFRDKATRHCLISAGNTRETQSVTKTNELLEKWKKRARELGAGEPIASDEIISVNTGAIRFPGITVQTTSIMGTKLLLPTRKNHFPTYEFTLIQDDREAIGLRPIVWVYNQLVGASSDTAPICMSRITVVPSKDNSKKIHFKIDSFLEIGVNFPAILLKILPIPIEKAEARGERAVKKILKSDIDTSLTKIRELYTAIL